MATKDCPLPEVAEALGPFVKPRDEVARIRQELQAYLQKQTGILNTPLSSINLTLPSEVQPNPPSAALSGVRRAYLQALRAHATAQEKYDSLKEDLEHLTAPSEDSSLSKEGCSVVNESLVPLLRQREKQRKLKAIEHAFSGVTATGKDTIDIHPDELVRQKAGDLPTPPTAQQPAFSDKPNVEAKVLDLKKALLAKKQKADQARAPPPEPNGHSSPGPEAQVAGLQAALNELTVWMEEQLAIIGTGESEGPDAPPTPSTNGHGASEPVNMDDIEALYEDYIDAREHLIATVNNPPSAPSPPQAHATPNGASKNSTDRRGSPAEALLPYIHRLASMKLQEQSRSQQSSYLRRQVSTAEADNQRLVARLADESHLVEPGSSRGRDWAEAGREAGKATTEGALRRVENGKKAITDAAGLLNGIRDAPKILEGL